LFSPLGAFDGEDVYQSLNLVIRRKAKENNFKAVLETIRDLVNAQGELKVGVGFYYYCYYYF
jgi:hypothetical protein